MGTPAGDILEGKLAEFFGTHTGAEAEEILLEAASCSRFIRSPIAMPTLITKRVKRLPRGNAHDDETMRGVNVVPKLKRTRARFSAACRSSASTTKRSCMVSA